MALSTDVRDFRLLQLRCGVGSMALVLWLIDNMMRLTQQRMQQALVKGVLSTRLLTALVTSLVVW
jgi:hypothetical protein